MADKQQGGAARQDFLDAGHGFGLKRGIAHRQRLVHDQDIGLHMYLHRKCQPHRHARAVGLDRLIDVIADVGKRDDVGQQGVDARAAQAQNRTIDVDVFTPGQVGVEARTQLQQRRHAAVGEHRTRAGRQYAGNDLQQGAFAAAIQADDAQRLPTVQAEADVVQGFMDVQPALRRGMQALREVGRCNGQRRAGAVQGGGNQALRGAGPDPERFADILDHDDRLRMGEWEVR